MNRTAREIELAPQVVCTLVALVLASGPCGGGLASASTLTVQGAITHAGSSAARVDVARSCSEDDRTLPDGTDYGGAATEEACVSLSAGDVDVLSGGDVTFRAGERIVLGSGFSVAGGAAFRAEVGPQVSGSAYVESAHPEAEEEYWARFYLLPDDLDLSGGDSFLHLTGQDGDGDLELAVGLSWDTGLAENRVFIQTTEDDGGLVSTQGTEELVLPDGWRLLELRWRASSGLDDGLFELCVDDTPDGGTQCAALTGLDNDTGRIESVRWGALGVPEGSLGTLYMDDFRSRKLGPIGGCEPDPDCP